MPTRPERSPRTVIFHNAFGGIPAGSKVFIASPSIVAKAMWAIPYGETRTTTRIRSDLARRRRCDATCPASFAIFARIAAQQAIDGMRAGASPDEVAPFWRMLAGSDKVARKLDIEDGWIDARRAQEAEAACAR